MRLAPRARGTLTRLDRRSLTSPLLTTRRAEQEEDAARRVRAAEEAQGLATRRLEEQKALEAKARQAMRHSEAR